MRRLIRWTGFALGSLAALVLVAYAVLYILSERILRQEYPIPKDTVSIPTDAASIAEGRRLAAIHGCFMSCHGPDGEGSIIFDQPIIGRLVAPNLTAAVRNYSDAELVAVIRHGLRPDGRSVIVMPSEAFVLLTDADLGRILAFLKSLPPAPGAAPSVTLGPLGRLGFITGQFNPAAKLIAETVPPPEAKSEQAALGRYLARTICAQCHGTDLRGVSNPDFTSPSLALVAAYDPQAFAQLLRTGVALGGRPLRVMGSTVRNNLSLLTDAEIAALYSYLHGLTEAAPTPRQ
jgi:mono/diheme cytochrome c family protein